MAELIRTKTGIQGLDKALNGGIPQGNLVLVSGGAGTGKSTLCLQYLINGAKLFGEKGLYVSTEQNHEELLKQAKSFGWDLENLELNNLLKIKYFDITEGNDFLKKVDQTVIEFQPKRIVIDSMTTLTNSMMVSGVVDEKHFSLVQVVETVSPIPRSERTVAKGILYKLIQEIRKHGKTTFLTSELPESGEKLSSDGMSEFICDGVIVLHCLGVGGSQLRSLQVRKMRYSGHNKDFIEYDISAAGIDIKEVGNPFG